MGSSKQFPGIAGILASRVETAPAGQSGQGDVKSILSPAAILHAPADTQQTPGHYSHINLFRVPCVCGYRGAWYSGEAVAMDAHRRHAERNAAGAF